MLNAFFHKKFTDMLQSLCPNQHCRNSRTCLHRMKVPRLRVLNDFVKLHSKVIKIVIPRIWKIYDGRAGMQQQHVW